MPKLMFIGTSTGMVRATTFPPSAAARSPAVSWRGTRSGTAESTVSTFQLIDRPAAADIAATSSISSSLNRSSPPSNAPSRNVPSCVAHRRAQGEDLVTAGVARRHGLAVAVAVGRRQGGREAESAGLDRLVQQAHHLGELVGRGLVADGVGAHDVPAQGAVADHEPGVDAERAVEAVEVLGERLPLPVDALLEGGERHALDLGHHAAQVVGVVGMERREGEAAVAGHEGGHAVDVGRRGERVPEELGVVVGVRVDEAGAHDEAARIELVARGVGDAVGGVVAEGDGDDPSVLHADVAGAPGAPVPSTMVAPRMMRSSMSAPRWRRCRAVTSDAPDPITADLTVCQMLATPNPSDHAPAATPAHVSSRRGAPRSGCRRRRRAASATTSPLASPVRRRRRPSIRWRPAPRPAPG